MANVDIPNYPGLNFPFKWNSASPDMPVGKIIGGTAGLLAYIYVFAGLILLVMLVWGGIDLMTAGGDPGKSKAGYGKISSGLIGFLIIFVSYFVMQIVEVVLKIKIL